MCDLSHVRFICLISTRQYGSLSVVCPSVEGRNSQVDLQLIPDLRCSTTLSLVLFDILIPNDGFKLFIQCTISLKRFPEKKVCAILGGTQYHSHLLLSVSASG